MNRSVRVLRRAERDLQLIYDFLLTEATASADRVIDELLEAIDSLATYSARGALPRDPFLRRQGYHFLVRGSYLIFYKATRRTVRIYRVLHGKRAYRELL